MTGNKHVPGALYNKSRKLVFTLILISMPFLLLAIMELTLRAFHYGDNLGALHADLTKTRQVLFNLLSNASKFTDHGVISLDVTRETTAAENREDWLIMCVTDTGIGMEPKQLDQLFDAFTQADASTTRKYEGSGLGLAIR